MADFPAANTLSATPGSQATFKSLLEQFLRAVKQIFLGGTSQQLSIASGVLSPVEGAPFRFRVDTEGLAASDDLDRITVTNVPDGWTIRIQAAAAPARIPQIRHGQGGIGQLLTVNSANFTLDAAGKFVDFQRNGSSFEEVDRGWAADFSGLRAFMGLGTAALVNTGTSAGNVPLVSSVLGKHSVWLWAPSWEPSTTAGCSVLQKVELVAGQPELVCLDFDGAVAESAFTPILWPKSWNAGTLDARFAYVVNAAVSTTVTLGLQGISIADNELLAQAYGTAVYVTDTYLGTANKLAVTAFTGAITVAGTPAEGELVYLRMLRDPSVDTTTQDVRVIGVQVRYTADKLTDS